MSQKSHRLLAVATSTLLAKLNATQHVLSMWSCETRRITAIAYRATSHTHADVIALCMQRWTASMGLARAVRGVCDKSVAAMWGKLRKIRLSRALARWGTLHVRHVRRRLVNEQQHTKHVLDTAGAHLERASVQAAYQVCCGVLQCVSVCSVLQLVAGKFSHARFCVAGKSSHARLRAAHKVCCSVLQGDAVRGERVYSRALPHRQRIRQNFSKVSSLLNLLYDVTNG